MSKAKTRVFATLVCAVITMANTQSLAAPETPTASLGIELNSPHLTEMSGITASPSQKNRYWAHNDSGDIPRLFAFNAKGELLSELKIQGAGAFDWEDIDSFRDTTGSYLLIADIGDNMAFRPFTDVYLIAEPIALKSGITETKVLRHYMLINEDGPRDAEALAVDSRERFVYILSKRDTHPRLYRFSLDSLAGQPVPVNFLGEIRSIPSTQKHQAQGTGKITRFSPTAMAFSPAGDAAIIVTLGKTYFFPRKPTQTWLEALNKTPITIDVKPMPQIEAGTFSRDGKQLLIGSEGSPARIQIIPSPRR